MNVYRAYFLLTKGDLTKAITLKLETTNNHYSDIFAVTAKANGNKIDHKKSHTMGRPKSQMKKASFDQLASFIGAI